MNDGASSDAQTFAAVQNANKWKSGKAFATYVCFVVLLAISGTAFVAAYLYLHCLDSRKADRTTNVHIHVTQAEIDKCATHEFYSSDVTWIILILGSCVLFWFYAFMLGVFDIFQKPKASDRRDWKAYVIAGVQSFFATIIQFGGLLLGAAILAVLLITAIAHKDSGFRICATLVAMSYYLLVPCLVFGSLVFINDNDDSRRKQWERAGFTIMTLAFLAVAAPVVALGWFGHDENRVREHTLRALAVCSTVYVGIFILTWLIASKCLEDRAYWWMKTFISRLDTEMLNSVLSWGCCDAMKFDKFASDSDDEEETVHPFTTAFGFSSVFTLSLLWTFGLAGFLMFPRKAGSVLDKMDVNMSQDLQLSAGALADYSIVAAIIYSLIWAFLGVWQWKTLNWDRKEVHAQHITLYAKKYQRVVRNELDVENRVLLSGKCKQAPQAVTPMFTL